ncbi:hypothetical protein [Billgrantia endophytica]|uniref:Uncharacterized protein n=1 Tax=Billgrantia endophytica TaxID=2033802 RepID=A0A2N7TUC2_9GAMM|nr:hypothetical protein [Halomonas endophytica]PMR71785.1 hypothetical protein C1H69_22900 [Halomonas endophytica]
MERLEQEQLHHKQIAHTILSQFGGHVALKLIGGRPAMGAGGKVEGSAVDMGNEGDTIVDIKFEGKAEEIEGVRPNVVRIIYCLGSDTYRMIFFRAVENTAVVLKEYDDVYCDMLQSLFEDTTGLFLYFK